MVCEPVLLPVTDLLRLSIGLLEAMSRAFIIQVGVGTVASTLVSNNTQVGEVESKLVSKSSEIATAE